MTIYRINNDGWKYQDPSIDLERVIANVPEAIEDSIAFQFPQHNLALASTWSTVPLSFKQIMPDSQDVPDICTWHGACLILSPKAYDAIGQLISPFGEFLPVDYEGAVYQIFNCRTFGRTDDINSKVEQFDGIPMGAEKLAFNAVDVIDKVIFKTQLNRCASCFCGDLLKEAIEKAGLCGIRFETDLTHIFP
jgi:hypothetical protein